jgi:uncharacterized protein (TIGR03083 family)
MQIYDEQVVLYDMAPELGDPARAWREHRARFLDRLAALTDDEWAAPSRCAEWTVRDVVVHLITTDQFWSISMQSGLAGRPTEFLRGFDPTTGTRPAMEPFAELGGPEVLAKIRDTTAEVSAVLDALGDDDWAKLGESPFGQVPMRLVVAHAHWDSWLHERDVTVGLGRSDPVEVEELAVAATYALLVGAVQGGAQEVEGGLDLTLSFADLPSTPIRLRVGDGDGVGAGPGGGANVSVGDASEAIEAGRAVDLVERYSGRLGDHLDDPAEVGRPDAPADLRPHLLLALDVL